MTIPTATPSIVNASLATIDAAFPNINPCNPAELPLGISVAIFNKHNPSPKNTLSTMPIAASSFNRVV